MQILRKKSDNTVWQIYPEASKIILDANGLTYTSADGKEKWIQEETSADYEIVANVAKPSNGRFYRGGVETYDDGTWTLDDSVIQGYRDGYTATGDIYDEDQFNITWRMQ
tara:strand:+ start:623 stop:952 length:330 start_codon:yes stop_codon:yes gene_type:complete